MTQRTLKILVVAAVVTAGIAALVAISLATTTSSGGSHRMSDGTVMQGDQMKNDGGSATGSPGR